MLSRQLSNQYTNVSMRNIMKPRRRRLIAISGKKGICINRRNKGWYDMWLLKRE